MTNKEAIEWLERIEERYILNGDEGFDKARKEALHMAIEALEQKSGKWYSYTRFHMNNWDGGYGCTCCKEWSAKESNYCPNCGAKMLD